MLLKVTTPSWGYQTLTNSMILYIEQRIAWYFYKDLKSEDGLCKLVPSLLPNQFHKHLKNTVLGRR